MDQLQGQQQAPWVAELDDIVECLDVEIAQLGPIAKGARNKPVRTCSRVLAPPSMLRPWDMEGVCQGHGALTQPRDLMTEWSIEHLISIFAPPAAPNPQDRELVPVRNLLSQLWNPVESMAAACRDGNDHWILQRNRLFACLFKVLERPEPVLRLPAARCVLWLLSAGRAAQTPSLQLPK